MQIVAAHVLDLIRREVLRCDPRPALQGHDAEAGLGEDLGGGAARRAGADDHDVDRIGLASCGDWHRTLSFRLRLCSEERYLSAAAAPCAGTGDAEESPPRRFPM